MKNKLNDFEIKDSYLQKYKTKDLNNLFNRLLEKEIRKKELIIIFYLINIISNRYKEYQQVTGNCNKNISPKTIDEFFSPSKLITTVKGTNKFTIINWSQLNIEIRDSNPRKVLFRKIINDKPSNHKIIERHFDELHLGLKTRAILKVFGHLKQNESYKHPLRKKEQVYRLNKSLKHLFKIPSNNNPFFWKKNQLNTKIIINAFDKNNLPVLPK